MKTLYIVLALLFVAGSALAASCYSSGDCGSSEYCDNTGTCKPYFSSSSSSSGCCAPAAILGLIVVGAVCLNAGKN